MLKTEVVISVSEFADILRKIRPDRGVGVWPKPIFTFGFSWRYRRLARSYMENKERQDWIRDVLNKELTKSKVYVKFQKRKFRLEGAKNQSREAALIIGISRRKSESPREVYIKDMDELVKKIIAEALEHRFTIYFQWKEGTVGHPAANHSVPDRDDYF